MFVDHYYRPPGVNSGKLGSTQYTTCHSWINRRAENPSTINHYIKIPWFKMDASQKSPVISEERSVGLQLRPQRRISSNSNQSSVHEICPYGFPGHHLPVQLSSFRNQHSPLAVHHDSDSGKVSLPPKRPLSVPILGWLARGCSVSTRSTSLVQPSSQAVQPHGIPHQLSKIRSGTQANFRFCGYPFQSLSRKSVHHPNKSQQDVVSG